MPYKVQTNVLEGELLPGSWVVMSSTGVLPGNPQDSFMSIQEGYYVGSWYVESVLYDFFENGHINGTPQNGFGFPAHQMAGPVPGRKIYEYGSELMYAGRNVRIGRRGARGIISGEDRNDG